MEAKKIVEKIPTAALLRDAESFGIKTTTERGFEISKVIQRGALVCLASTIPLFTLRTYEAQMSYPLHEQAQEQSMEPLKSHHSQKPPTMDLSTLQDAVSGLGFVLDPPQPSQEVNPFSLSYPEMVVKIPPSGIAPRGML
jgi:hypothetical protein